MNKIAFRKTVKSTLRTVCFLTAIAMAYVPPVKAQDVNSRIQRIENEIETLSRAVFRGEKPPAGSVMPGGRGSTGNANAELRLQQIEMELRNLTGSIEQRNYEDQQFRSQMEQAIAALEMRIAALEMNRNAAPASMTGPLSGYPDYQQQPYNNNGYGVRTGGGNVSSGLGMSAAGAPSQPSPYNEGQAGQGMDSYEAGSYEIPGYETGGYGAVEDEAEAEMYSATSPAAGEIAGEHSLGVLNRAAEPAAFPQAPPMRVQGDPAGLYEQAFSYLRERDYAQAEAGFRSFLDSFPGHDLAANAQYWLGESLYVRNDYENAARVFAEGYQKYPKGPKGPDNLLKLGMALSGMGKNNDACLTYGQLQKEYPGGAMPILMRAEQEMEKLGCQQF